jgi:hypothetical protein
MEFFAYPAENIFGQHSAEREKRSSRPVAENLGNTQPKVPSFTFCLPQPQSSPVQPQAPSAPLPFPIQSKPSTETKVQAALAALGECGYSGLRREDLGKLNPGDEYETELRVMAEVRGYFQVAYKVRQMPSVQGLF